jgi:hypothetical protein
MPIPRVGLTLLMLMACAAHRAHAQDKLDLQLHLTKGDSRQVTVTLDQTIQQTVQSAAQTTTQSLSVTYTFAVKDVDAKGNATVSVRYDAVAFNATAPTGKIEYDSSKPASGQSPPMASGLAALVGQSYAMTVSPRGTITQVSGLPKMLDSVLARLNLPEGPLRTAAEKALRLQLSEPNLKQGLSDIFAPFPDHPVSVGESWTRARQVHQGFPMKLQTTYTLESRENGVARVKVAGKAATASNATLDLGPMKMNYDLKGEQAGTMEIIESSGWTRQSELRQRLSGSATLRAPNADPQTVPVTIQSTVKSTQREP